jgi:hypothetical protein
MQTVEGKELVDGLLKVSRDTGRDLWEVMEETGRLLTPARRREVKSEGLDAMLYILEAETAERVLQRYLGGRPGTPQDMFDALLAWIKDYRAATEDGHV